MLTDDSKAVVALTTRLGSPARPSLTAQAWSRFNTALSDSGYSPASVFQMKGSIAAIPGVEDPERIEQLLEDASVVNLEVDELQRRGIWTITLEDESYPSRLIQRLGKNAPPVLFGVGQVSLLGEDAIGIVGSRNVGEDAKEVAESIAQEAVRLGFPVASGGARGVDQISMNAAYQSDGNVVGVLADSLLARIKSQEILAALDHGSTCLIVEQSPATGFSPGAAMSRNKLIYGLSVVTVVVATDDGTGGTWAGATEALKKEISSVMVWRGDGEGPGNASLERLGATRLESVTGLGALLNESTDFVQQMSLLEQ